MRCEEARPLIDGYLDGELDFEHNLELESHLEGCAVCAPARRSALELRSAIQQQVPYFRAPRARIAGGVGRNRRFRVQPRIGHRFPRR